jgi:archaellum component FlaC
MSSKKTQTTNDASMEVLFKEMHRQLQEQTQVIEEMRNELKHVSAETNKMTKHIDFINDVYSKIRNSYVFKNLF